MGKSIRAKDKRGFRTARRELFSQWQKEQTAKVAEKLAKIASAPTAYTVAVESGIGEVPASDESSMTVEEAVIKSILTSKEDKKAEQEKAITIGKTRTRSRNKGRKNRRRK